MNRLAQAMVLTSLVITFATMALLLSLVFRLYGVFRTLDGPESLHEAERERRPRPGAEVKVA